MKSILLLAVVVLFFGCEKGQDNDLCDTYLEIDSTSTPRSSTVGTGITSIINCYGPSLCYSYAGMDISGKGGNIFEIHAKGKIRCNVQICALALYQVRDTITISTPAAGSYFLKFYNNTTLLKTDTITVN
jgi:hypothetical protein